MFKVYVKTTGDVTWSSNAIQHDSIEAARAAAVDLFGRWFAVEKWAVVPAEFSGQLHDATIVEVAVMRSDE